MIKICETNRFVGFKFVLPPNFPFEPPMVFLDEPENELLIEIIDYLDEGNRIMFSYIDDWKRHYSVQNRNYNLQILLCKVYELYCKAPPIPLEEM